MARFFSFLFSSLFESNQIEVEGRKREREIISYLNLNRCQSFFSLVKSKRSNHVMWTSYVFGSRSDDLSTSLPSATMPVTSSRTRKAPSQWIRTTAWSADTADLSSLASISDRFKKFGRISSTRTQSHQFRLWPTSLVHHATRATVEDRSEFNRKQTGTIAEMSKWRSAIDQGGLPAFTASLEQHARQSSRSISANERSAKPTSPDRRMDDQW